jgi:hypothetical protein
MAFRPNYRQERAGRERLARAKQADKQKRLEEKTAERRAAREAGAVSSEEEQPS